MTTTISSSHPTMHVHRQIVSGVPSNRKPITDKTLTEQVHAIHDAGIYGQRGTAVIQALNKIAFTA